MFLLIKKPPLSNSFLKWSLIVSDSVFWRFRLIYWNTCYFIQFKHHPFNIMRESILSMMLSCVLCVMPIPRSLFDIIWRDLSERNLSLSLRIHHQMQVNGLNAFLGDMQTERWSRVTQWQGAPCGPEYNPCSQVDLKHVCRPYGAQASCSCSTPLDEYYLLQQHKNLQNEADAERELCRRRQVCCLPPIIYISRYPHDNCQCEVESVNFLGRLNHPVNFRSWSLVYLNLPNTVHNRLRMMCHLMLSTVFFIQISISHIWSSSCL